MSRRDPIAWLSSAAFVAAIVLANWLTTRYGFVPVGLGLSATAGTYARAMDCDSVDGTFLTFGPDVNLVRLLAWLERADAKPMLWEVAQ